MNETNYTCDFCGKPFVGYTSMQAAFYCQDHQVEAEEIESNMWAEVEKTEREQD